MQVKTPVMWIRLLVIPALLLAVQATPVGAGVRRGDGEISVVNGKPGHVDTSGSGGSDGNGGSYGGVKPVGVGNGHGGGGGVKGGGQSDYGIVGPVGHESGGQRVGYDGGSQGGGGNNGRSRGCPPGRRGGFVGEGIGIGYSYGGGSVSASGGDRTEHGFTNGDVQFGC